MSSPWAWLGNEFPSLQGQIARASTGDGTDFQVIWNMTDGATTDDQICKFEWTAKQITFTISGTVDLPFFVASTGATEFHSTAFSKTLVYAVNNPGSTWDVNEVPNGFDYPTTSSVFISSGSNAFSIPVTLSDGSSASFGFDIIIFMGSISGSPGLYGIAESLVGRVYSEYTKELILTMSASSNTGSPSNITMALNKTGLSGTLVPLGPQTTFGTTANVYYTAPQADGSTLSLSAFSLLVTDSSTAPPNI